MSLITLTTDFGTKDYYVSTVKGAIYTELPNAVIVDITHQIPPFNIRETAYIIKNSYKSFPDKSIHIIGVDSELSPENKHIALLLDNHYFICADNGIISMISSEIKPTKIVEINIEDRIKSESSALNVFVKVACFIARGGNLNVIGKEIKSHKKMIEIQPKIDGTKITGSVIYIDNYGNVISNINKKLFLDIGKKRNYKITAGKYTFNKISQKYNDIVDYTTDESKSHYDGSNLAIFNSAGFLEIAIYRSNLSNVGGASTLLGLNYGEGISVEFFDK